jgi:RNA polymerase sigma-70 factor (ECF subfamily)
MIQAAPDSETTQRLLDQARAGDRHAFERLFERHGTPLQQMIEARIDARLRGRIDPSDVVQDTHLEAFRRLDDYLERQPMPFHLWLRKMAYERLLNLRRDHVTTARRSVVREVPLPDPSSLQLAARFLGRSSSRTPASTPSARLARSEIAVQMRQALAQLPEDDREILLLRYVDNLSNQDCAALLEISGAAASKRHGRAILRMHKILLSMGLQES